MRRFINTIITRHLAPTPAVQPRLRGRFEGLEPATGQLAAEDRLESTDALRVKPAFGSKVEETEMMSGQNVHQNLPADQLYFMTDRPKVDSENKDGLLLQGTFVNAVGEGTDSAENPADGISKTGQPTSHADQGSAERSGNKGPIESHSIRVDSASGRTSKGPDIQYSHRGQPLIDEMDLSTNRNSHIPDFEIAHESEQSIPALPRTQQEKSQQQQYGDAQSNSLIGAVQNTDIPGFRHTFEHGFNTPEQPVIKVSIGRINIRAEVKKVAPVLKKKQSTFKPALSLEDYLKNQNNTKR